MDREDERNQKVAEIHEKLLTAYIQSAPLSPQFELSDLSHRRNEAMQENSDNCETSGTQDDKDISPGLVL